jgi:hypothetical protein
VFVEHRFRAMPIKSTLGLPVSSKDKNGAVPIKEASYLDDFTSKKKSYRTETQMVVNLLKLSLKERLHKHPNHAH